MKFIKLTELNNSRLLVHKDAIMFVRAGNLGEPTEVFLTIGAKFQIKETFGQVLGAINDEQV